MSEIVYVMTKAMRMMLGNQNGSELIFISFPGSSGARVSIFRHSHTGSLYAVKCAREPRISLMDEVGRREALKPYLQEHLPQILWCQMVDGFEVMISECSGIHTLHYFIVNSDIPHSRLLAIWQDVTQKFVHMWKESQHQFQESLCPRFFPARLERIKTGVQSLMVDNIRLHEYWEAPIIVNDNEHLSLARSFETIARVGKPTIGVVCHGDPQPSNIVVGRNDGWYCIDWEWTGSNQDWRMMISHFYGWWATRCLVLPSEPTIRVIRNRLEIEYNAFIPTHLHSYQDITLSMVSTMSNGYPSEEIVKDINKYLAALYFGELRFLNLWGRKAFTTSMIAQAVITASELSCDKDVHSFKFPQQKE